METSGNSEKTARRTLPRQERAQQTVARIKQTMLKIVAEHGYAAATTNRIAEEAHVNIATVYHYFPNQHAIAHAIYEEVMFDMAELLNDMFMANIDRPLNDSIRRFIARLVEFMKKEALVLLRFSDQIPGLHTSTKAIAMGNIGRNAARSYLRQKLLQVDGEQIDCKLYFASNMTMGMIQHYLFDPHPKIRKAQFVAELSDIISSYLEAPPTLPVRRSGAKSKIK